jgi:serine/threonine protein kinase
MCGGSMASPVLGETVVGEGRGSRGASSSWELAPEKLQAALGSSYELGRLLGRGGYAEVFAVRDTRLKRELAIKVLRPDLILTEALVARFRREAEAVAALEHPNIVPIYDVGEGDGICWLVMPLVRGETLKSRLAREQRIAVPESRRILAEAANALQAAHSAGVVHRDIKPENLMLESKTGRVLLMDFGIAKAMDTSGNDRITGTGVVIGTPQYMSPEQAMGSQSPDPRSDQYSLAVVGYQMASGTVPFEGDNVREVIARQMLEEPIPLSRWVPDIPPAMSRAIHQALNKDPKKRFASIDAFSRSMQGEIVAPAEGGRVAPRASKFNIPHRKRQWAAAVVWILTIGGVAWAGNRLEFLGGSPAAPATPDSSGGSPPSVRPSPDPAPARQPPSGGPSRPVPSRHPVTPAAGITSRDTTAPLPVAPAPTCKSAYAAAEWGTAFSLCKAAADTSISARRMLGIMYAEGKGVAEDQRQASAYLRDAAEEADLPAVWLMAQRYDAGLGTDPNAERASGFYLLAATLGKTEAWPIVAERYAAGNGFKKNDEAAFEWWRRAADTLGDLRSMTRVAEAYSRGRGVKKDELLAQSWYFRAAEQGDPEAEYQVGMMHIRGKGVAKNPFTARGWLEKAAARGHEAARLELAKLTPPS